MVEYLIYRMVVEVLQKWMDSCYQRKYGFKIFVHADTNWSCCAGWQTREHMGQKISVMCSCRMNTSSGILASEGDLYWLSNINLSREQMLTSNEHEGAKCIPVKLLKWS
ncbi:uncharacterized protein LOC116261825 [Nymphaea colorata]|nr:uncharacterized protein LOC116261825 [Nymphaea colorata]